MIEKIINFIIDHPKKIIIAICLFSIVVSIFLAKLQIGTSLETVYPPKGDPDRVFLEKTYKDFGSDCFLAIAVTADNVFSAPTLKKIKELTSKIEKISSVERVFSLSNANIIKSEKDEIYLHSMPDDVFESNEAIQKFKNDILENPLYRQNLVSKDLTTTVISVFYDANAPKKVAALDTEEMAKAEAGPEGIYVAGPVAISSAMFGMLSKDLKTYLPFSFFIIVIILFIVFRNLRVALLSLVSIGVSVICTYAIMAMAKVPIFLLTATIPPIIAAQGVSYCVHLFSEYFKQRSSEEDQKRAVKQTLRYTLLAIWLSAFTTSIGFVSISPVNVVAVRQMGIFLSIGVAILFFLVAFLIPSVLVALFPKLHGRNETYNPLATGSFNWFPIFCMRHRIPIFIFSTLLAIVSIYGLSKINVETDVHQFFRPSAPFRKAVDVIASRLHGTTPVSVIIETPEEGDVEDPSFLHSVEKLQAILDDEPNTGKTVSVVDYLKIINQTLHNNDPKYYVLPESKEATSQYLLIYSLADPQKTLDKYIDYDHRIIKIDIRTSLTSSTGLLKFKDFIDKQCASIFPQNISWRVTSDSMLIASTTQKLTKGILYGFSQAGVAIFLIMLFLFRSIKMGIVAMVPNVAPLLFLLGLIGFARIDFNMGTSIVICIAVGIAVDDTIHFLVRYFYELKQTNHYLIRANTSVKITDDQKQAVLTTFRHQHSPITLTALVVILSFIVLAFSQFVPIAMFGILTAAAMLFGIICELIILPALLASIKI